MDDIFVERVLRYVEAIPPGSALSYGDLAGHLGANPRLLGRVMAQWSTGTPWWRVIRADGTLPSFVAERAQNHWLAEGTPLLAGARPRVNLRQARPANWPSILAAVDDDFSASTANQAEHRFLG